jgi:hypothetical protein
MAGGVTQAIAVSPRRFAPQRNDPTRPRLKAGQHAQLCFDTTVYRVY